MVVIYKNNTPKAVRVSGVIAKTFLGPRPEGYQVNHKDTNKANNAISNLEYVTPKENVHHAWANGCCKVFLGQKHPNSKLTDKQAAKIKRIYALGGITQKELAAKFGVHKSTIQAIIIGRYWKHI